MSSKIVIKPIEVKMSEEKGFKKLVGKRMNKKLKFMGEDVTIYKLSVAQVQEIQAEAKIQEAKQKAADLLNDSRALRIKTLREAGENDAADELASEPDDTADADGFGILRTVLRSAVEGAEDITDEDFAMFPMDELTTLSNEIMTFSGVGAKGK